MNQTPLDTQEKQAATPAVEIRNLTKIFPVPLRREKVVAVRDLSLSVAPGQVYGLLGPNGSGKSTTLKVVLGLVRPSAGGAKVFGRDTRDVESREQVGFVPENPYFYKFLTGEETLRFYGKLCGISGKPLRDRVAELLNLVGMEDARHRRIGGYSKGMLQRIGLAQALVQDPRLVVLDEPTAGVDPVGSREIRDLIQQLKNRGITVLLTTHLLEQVQEVCDRVAILARGRIVREGKLEELLSIDSQTEVRIEDAPADLQARIASALAGTDARVISIGKPKTTLEGVFLEAAKE